MTVSSHHPRLNNALRRIFTSRVRSLSVVLSRVVLLSIVSGVMFMSEAMATDATSREHAIEIAKAQNGGDGKVLGVATETDSAGNTRYSVKLLSNGRVRVFTITKAP